MTSKTLKQMESEMLDQIREMIKQSDELIITLEQLNQYFNGS